MKLFLSLLLCLCLGLPASAQAEIRQNGQPYELTATVLPVWILLEEIARDIPGTNTGILLPSGSGCPHDYAMTPADRRKLARADVLVMNGLGLESFLGDSKKALSLMKPGAALIDTSQGMAGVLHSKGHSHGDDDHHSCASNPHIFASPSMMAQMARSLASQLTALFPDQAARYEANAAEVIGRLEALAAECRDAGSSLKSRTVITQHDIFDYLARDMGLTVEAHIQAHSGQEPSARAMLDLVRLIRAKDVSAVIVEPQYPARAGRTLAAETGIPCVTLDPAANGPDGLKEPLSWYESIMRENLRILEQALGTR